MANLCRLCLADALDRLERLNVRLHVARGNPDFIRYGLRANFQIALHMPDDLHLHRACVCVFYDAIYDVIYDTFHDTLKKIDVNRFFQAAIDEFWAKKNPETFYLS
jgi:hypothetical protein